MSCQLCCRNPAHVVTCSADARQALSVHHLGCKAASASVTKAPFVCCLTAPFALQGH